ncbi:MAG: hypothetical protein J0M04_05870 [Verrucomicrobia bacterium]|nr:hypothetical protein [Verrucomicrobiota bacterium]
MKSSGGVARRRRKNTPVPEPWTVKDRVKVFGAFAAVLLFFFAIPASQSVMMERRIVSERLSHWKFRFHLSESEVQRLREIEFDFHGSGFSFIEPKRSLQQVEDHKWELSRAMSPESALDFIKHHEKWNPCGR